MSESRKAYSPRYGESIFSAVTAGFVLILIGVVLVTTPGLIDAIVSFFNDFSLVKVPHTDNIYFFAPESVSAHGTVYEAAQKFSLILGFFHILILAFRFVAGSTSSRKAQTVSDAVSSIGGAYLIQRYLVSSATTTSWFVFWAAMLMLWGISLIVRAGVLATRL